MKPDDRTGEIEAAAQKIADGLIGACMNTAESMAEECGVELTPEIEEAVNELCCECGTCGWVFEVSDLDENGDCDRCASEDDEDDEG